MRILQVAHGFPPDSIAGTEQYCEALSRQLLRRGHECFILAGSERSAPEATLETVDQDGLLVTRYLRAQARPRRWTEEYDPEAEVLARHLLAFVNPDIVHLHQWQRLTDNLVAVCADIGTPVVVTLHDAWTSCPRNHRIRWDGIFCTDPLATAPCLTCAERGPWQGDAEIASALALRREVIGLDLALATTILVPSESHRAFLRSLLELPEDRLTVLPHGSPSTVGSRQARDEGAAFPNRPLQIGHWGYLMYLKGTHLILEAVHQLHDPSAVQVHLIGAPLEGPYEERLRELARGISVKFHGAYRPAELPSFDLDIAVFPSIASESYSFTLDEALSIGLPVLVSDRGALPERIGAGGFTFRAADAGDLARRLQEILDAPERLDTMRRSIRTETLFSMEAHVTMMEKIYEDATLRRKTESHAERPYLKLLVHARQQLTDREESLAGLQQRLAQAEQAIHEKEALLEQATRETEALLAQATRERELLLEQSARTIEAKEAILLEREALLQQAAQAIHEKERLLQERDALVHQTRRSLAILQEDHANLRAYLLALRGTPLFRLQELLGKLSKRSS